MSATATTQTHCEGCGAELSRYGAYRTGADPRPLCSPCRPFEAEDVEGSEDTALAASQSDALAIDADLAAPCRCGGPSDGDTCVLCGRLTFADAA
jgi:hypothetical protein